jgi:hypothetical protein
MSKRSSARQPATPKPAIERRAPRGKPGSLSWLKGLLGRPVALERREGQLHMTLVDRRRSPAEVEAQALQALRHELQTRLVAHDVEHAARVMRHLVFVHDELGRKGWAGVARMSSTVLGKAQLQVEMLHSRENSLLLADMVDKLRLLKVAAEVREEQRSRRAADPLTGEVNVEVSETTHEEFEETERSWVGTLPPGLTRPEPER